MTNKEDPRFATTICRDIESLHAMWKHKLMTVAINAYRRRYRENDGILDESDIRYVDSVLKRIVDDLPPEAAAWYSDGAAMRAAWINHESVRDLIKAHIDLWHPD